MVLYIFLCVIDSSLTICFVNCRPVSDPSMHVDRSVYVSTYLFAVLYLIIIIIMFYLLKVFGIYKLWVSPIPDII